MEILNLLNSWQLYAIVGVVILYVFFLCLAFAIRAFKAGKKAGLDVKKMKRAVTASATFSVLPSVGILIGVIALAGSLGVPLPWFRLSVIGALHYETQVAQAAAETLGIGGLKAANMTPQAFTTIALLMGFCICWGMIFSTIFTKGYMKKLSGKNPDAKKAIDEANTYTDKKGKVHKKFSIGAFGDTAMCGLFIGLVSAYIGSYIVQYVKGIATIDGNVQVLGWFKGDWIPLATAAIGALMMAFFTFLKDKCHQDWVDNFSVAASMIIAMAGAVFLSMIK